MAATDPPNEVASPARRLARLLASKRRLSPPVDVTSVARDYATIETADFPGTWDAILWRPRGSREHTIFLAANRAPRGRVRFTLAHELAHIVLPWQHGTVFCHTDFSFSFGDEITRQIEADANAFAAELLVPLDWAAARLQAPPNLAKAVAAIADDAEVSVQVAMYAAQRCLEPHTVLALVNEDGAVEHFAVSDRPGATRSRAPAKGERFDLREFKDAGGVASRAACGARSLVAIQFPQPASIRLPRTRAPSAGVLEAILQDIATPATYIAIERSVAGIVGAFNSSTEGRCCKSVEEYYRELRLRFLARENLPGFTGHNRFDEFVAARARELFGRR